LNGGFTKLFSTIITSSVWSEDDKTRLMWITMLATADPKGYVAGTIPGMAAMARMSLADAEAAIAKLCSPDKYSRTPDHEGRRLLPVDGGWQIANYLRYRDRRDPEKRRQQNREAKRRQREREQCQQDVSHVSQMSAQDRRQKTEDRNNPPVVPPEGEADGDQDLFENSRPQDPPQLTASPNGSITFDYDSGQFAGITEERMATWREAYPAVDIDIEIKRAAIWLVDNPSKRKKHLGWFLSGWFSRTQERGGTKGGPVKRDPKRGDPDWLPTDAEADEILREARVTQ